MDRKEFLASLGLSAGTFVLTTCLGGCSKSSSNTGSGGTAPTVDFTLDLTLPANAALKNNGGYLYSNGAIVARTTAGAYVAVSQACTHQGVTVQYVSGSNQFYCPSHGASFSTTGGVTGGPANGALKQYTVTQTGNNLRVNG